MDLKDKALEVIEELTCNDDFGAPDASPEKKLLTKIYCFVHVARGHCENPHEDWVAELEKYHKHLCGGKHESKKRIRK